MAANAGPDAGGGNAVLNHAVSRWQSGRSDEISHFISLSRCFIARLNLALDLRLELIARDLQVVILLHSEPEFGRSAEVAR